MSPQMVFFICRILFKSTNHNPPYKPTSSLHNLLPLLGSREHPSQPSITRLRIYGYLRFTTYESSPLKISVRCSLLTEIFEIGCKQKCHTHMEWSRWFVIFISFNFTWMQFRQFVLCKQFVT